MAREYNEAQQAAIRTFSTVGKLSDFVTGLSKFDGKPTDLVSWITDVEGIFDLYRDLPRDTTQYQLLERSIRRKIVDEASDVLNANNVFYNWQDIKSTLLLYYRDKRDVKTLDYELTTVKKKSDESLSAYFSRVNELLTNIIVQVQTDESMNRTAAAHINYFRSKALDSFIRGLEQPLNILLKSANVETLSKAYQFCLDYYNLDIRSAPFRNEKTNHPIPKPRGLELNRQTNQQLNPPPAPLMLPPPAPPRYFRMQPPQPVNRQFMHPPPVPPRNLRMQSEPMEIDRSIMSRNVDYGNRPRFYPNPPNFNPNFRPIAHEKRTHPPTSQQPFKRQAYPLEDANLYYSHDYDTYYNYDPNEYYYYVPDNPETHDTTEPTKKATTTKETTAEATEDNKVPESTNFLEWNQSW